MTVTVTGLVHDVTGRPDKSQWVFSSVLRGGTADSVVSTTHVYVAPDDAGLLTVTLDPGPASVRYGGDTIQVTVPESDIGLWDLIEAGVAAPPNTGALALAAAIAAYFDAHPGGGGGGGGITDVVQDATPQLGGNLDLNGHTVGDASAADLTKLHALAPTSTELNFVDGVTSAIQTQMDGKQPLDPDLTALAALTSPATKLAAAYVPGGIDIPITDGGTGVSTLPTGILKGAGTSAITAATAGTDYVAPGGALGTPASGNLANCTFPTLNQNTTGSAATLTTTRNINGVAFNGSADVRLVPQVTSTASNATPALDATKDSTVLTAQAAAITAFSLSGAFMAEQKHMIRIKDSGAARAITWTSTVIVAADGITLPTTTVVGKTHRIGCIYDELVGKLIAVAVGTY